MVILFDCVYIFYFYWRKYHFPFLGYPILLLWSVKALMVYEGIDGLFYLSNHLDKILDSGNRVTRK